MASVYTGQTHQRRSGPKFAPGAGPWPEDSDTEQETSPESRNHRSPQHNSHAAELDGREYIDSSIDPAPPIPYWSAKRHLTCGNPTPPPPWSVKPISWRSSSSGKLKTAAAGLVICLNADIDPPDIVKTRPCATLECWVDPHSLPSQAASEAIGLNLQHQFEGLSLKIQYKNIFDPTFDELRKSCINLRKIAKDDAVLFHYNGHGVPKPTNNGELWCFNKTYTQYIPVSLQEIQLWIGSPGVYIWDCSAAGYLLTNFIRYAEQKDRDVNFQAGGYAPGVQPFSQALQLAACLSHEQLPSCPELPADVFTSCLTSPIDIALRYFIMNHQLPNNVSADMIMQLPGDLKDRRTPLGELNWIFTAITDTIAWTTFDRALFSRLYRSDLLIASLFRNFLLAERIMKNYNCTPHTSPPLISTNTHPLWATWDLAVDTCIRQLPNLVKIPDPATSEKPSPPPVAGVAQPGRIGRPYSSRNGPQAYVPSRFFADQLTAFEVWISRGGSALTRRGPLSLPVSGLEKGDIITEYDVSQQHHLVPRKPPDQLPIVLQVLLSQPHRLRALILLSQFVDLGPWAVNLVLSIGIFPYISKLLQAPGPDLRPVLIFIWARILAVDPSVQVDLYNNQGYKYFANILGMRNDVSVLPNSSEHQAMCSFILSALSRGYPNGQEACWNEHVFEFCFERLDEPDFLLRQWTALCIGQMWDGNDPGRFAGVQMGAPDKFLQVLSDDSAEVRCAALFALGTFMGASGSADLKKRGGGGSGPMRELEERDHMRMEVSCVTGATLAIKDDASPMCRKELLVVISCLVKEWRGHFVICAWIYWEEERRWRSHQRPSNEESVTDQAVSEWLDNFGDDELYREQTRQLLSSFFTIFVVLLNMTVDPYHEVATNAQTIVDYIMALLLESPFTRHPATTLDMPPSAPHGYRPPELPRSRVPSVHSSPTLSAPPPSPGPPRPTVARAETMSSSISNSMSNTIKRTSSFANALKSLTNGIVFPTMEDIRSSPTHGGPDGAELSRAPSPNLNFAQYTSPYSRPSTPPNGAPPQYDSQPPLPPPPPEFFPSHVMEALTEEDMERLRARKHHRSHSHRHANGHHSLPSPTFSDSSLSSLSLGLGTGLGIRNVLPLKSTFFDWCCEYFTEPQMRQTEADEPGSVQYTYQVWRQQRNEQVDIETRTQADVASYRTWDRSVATLHAMPNPLTMTFHSYDQHLIIANESDIVSVWDWSQRKRLNHFCNGNPKGTSITSMHIINQDVGGILITGSADGLVRLYRNYDPTLEQGPLQMVSAFRGLTEVVQVKQGAGVVMDWKQSSGILLVGGDSHVIKSWDAQTEIHGMDMDTNSDSPVTSIVSDHGASQTFVAGFGDGTVKVFDRRLEEEESIVRSYSEHTAWVQSVRPHPTLSSQFFSASLDGEVKLWDLRGADTAADRWTLNSNGISAFDVHSMADVAAGTSSITQSNWRSQRISVRSLSGDPLTTFNVSTGQNAPPSRAHPSPYIPRTSSFVFHPTEMLYGVGEPDGTIRIMGCKLP